MPEQPVGGDLAILHLAHVARLDPRRSRRLRNALARERLGAGRHRHAVARRVATDVRRDERDEPREHRVVHAGPHPPHVAQATFDELGELQRADERARAVRLRVADDHEVARAVRLDLEPARRPSGDVRALRPLRDESLEPQLRHLAEHELSLARDVVERPHGAELRYALGEQPTALDERNAAKVEVLEREEIEREEGGRQLDRGLRDVERIPEQAAPLQPGEARPALIVHHRDLAVDDARVVRQCPHRARHLGEDSGVIEAVAREEQDVMTALRREQAIAVELELEQPVVARERLLARFGEHHLHRSRIDTRLHRTGAGHRRAQLHRRPLAGLHLLDGEPRQHRGLVELVARGLHVRVALLEQQPVLLAALGLHERPLAAKLVALQLEDELPLLEPLAPILERHPLAAVPYDDTAGAVVPLRDYPLEVAVLDRMVLDAHGEALVDHVVRRALRHRPRFEHAVHLHSQVEVEMTRRVLVHDEEPPRDDRDGADRLRRRIGGAFGAVRCQAIRRLDRCFFGSPVTSVWHDRPSQTY